MVPRKTVSGCTKVPPAPSLPPVDPHQGLRAGPPSRNVPALTQWSAMGAPSIYEDRRAHGNHLVQGLDVLVAQSDAPVTDRAANALRFVGSVEGVAVSQVQPMRPQHALVLALVGAEWRDDDVPRRHHSAPLHS